MKEKEELEELFRPIPPEEHPLTAIEDQEEDVGRGVSEREGHPALED